MGNITLDFQSSGMQPSFAIPLDKSNNHWVAISYVTCIISADNPDSPGALCLFIFFNAATTSTMLIQSAGPSLTSADIPRSHSFSSFIFFRCTLSMNLSSLFHLQSLYVILLSDSLTLLYPVFLLPSALPFKKFHFGARDHVDHLHISSVSCPLPRK